jgi:elongation factor G
MTDLQSRRALIQGVDSEDRYQVLKALIPRGEMSNFSSQLRSLTQGRANFTSVFHSYKAVPVNIQKRLTETKEAVGQDK